MNCAFEFARLQPTFSYGGSWWGTARILINEWVKTAKPGWVNKAAQHQTKVWDNEDCLIEVVKYGSKIFTEPDVNKTHNSREAGQFI